MCGSRGTCGTCRVVAVIWSLEPLKSSPLGTSKVRELRYEGTECKKTSAGCVS